MRGGDRGGGHTHHSTHNQEVLTPLGLKLTTGKFNASGVPYGKDWSQFRGKKQRYGFPYHSLTYLGLAVPEAS